MARLNIDKQKKVEPIRLDYAISRLKTVGFEPIDITNVSFKIKYKNNLITIYPYSGWFSGKGVKDGRGLDNLLKQLINETTQ